MASQNGSLIQNIVDNNMITGSTATGEALSLHFQFLASAKSEKPQQMKKDMAKYYPGVVGNFGCEEDGMGLYYWLEFQGWNG